MNVRPAPDLDAALVLGMASTALPFARSPTAEAERWLRILRMHGEAGAALQALGVSEAPLEGLSWHLEDESPAPDGQGIRDVVAAITQGAVGVATRRGAPTVGSGEVLVAVMQFYGEDFDSVLEVRGTDRREVLERLGIETADAGPDPGC